MVPTLYTPIISSWSMRVSSTHRMQTTNCSLLVTSVHSAIITKKSFFTMLQLISRKLVSAMSWSISFCISLICFRFNLNEYDRIIVSLQIRQLKLLSAPAPCPLSGHPCRARKQVFFWKLPYFFITISLPTLDCVKPIWLTCMQSLVRAITGSQSCTDTWSSPYLRGLSKH